MTKNGTLTTKQAAAIQALLQSSSITKAAQVAGVSTTTIYRWLEDAQFSAILSDAQGQAISAAVRSLTALAERAIAVIRDALDDPEATHSTKLRAAGLSLEMLLRLRDSHEIEQRLAALEGRSE